MCSHFRNTALKVSVLALGMCLSAWAPASIAQEKSDRKITKRVDPAYPPLAVQLRLSGSVKLVAQVAADGKVESVRTLGGSPILAAAAENAVKQWKYEATPKESSEVVNIAFEAPK